MRKTNPELEQFLTSNSNEQTHKGSNRRTKGESREQSRLRTDKDTKKVGKTSLGEVMINCYLQYIL